MTARPFEETLHHELQDPQFAAAYLQDALEDNAEEFLVALRHVVRARGGMTRFAESTKLSREAMYKMLSEKGNPEFRSIQSILREAGFAMQVTPIRAT